MGLDLPNLRDGKVLEKPSKACRLQIPVRTTDTHLAFAAGTMQPRQASELSAALIRAG
jgi:hypothetical protein